MKYEVSDACVMCGMCAGICPEIFVLSPKGKAEAKDIDTDLPRAQEAVLSCPMHAIHIKKQVK
ncbi:ferredoxin [Catenisphaera adipataccumulans]|jgi:ferredoxin|uniref:Ferredoxin n=1 Tax=Catenisphaera adipataccumulans TaxID=700500 RepID=A0A7W8FVJ5_9FIRM|nr:ferredoxin [Catenisphaera adipataccumulans]MBB5182261.1 ferredoxin [Catenisphaera adipataccumulans]